MKRTSPLASWVELEGCFNFRDLGGYATDDGRRLRARQVFRSDGLQHLTARDLSHLRDEIALGGVIDLRSRDEIESDGRGLIAHEDLEFHHLPLFPETPQQRDPASAEFPGDMGQLYYFILKVAAEPIARVVEIVSESDAPHVFHCAAGKDRTGVISALLLSLLGVPRETILADYAFSKQNLDQVNARLRASDTYRALMDDLPDGAWEAEPATMASFLERVDRRYGSMREWAEQAGIGERTVERLRARLLEDA